MSKPEDWVELTPPLTPFPSREPKVRTSSTERERGAFDVTLRLNATQHAMLVGLVTGVAHGMTSECRGAWNTLLNRLRSTQ